MSIDLHVHSRDCSDGRAPLTWIIPEARKRGVRLLSITDHDAIGCQDTAMGLASEAGIQYLTGVELSISFSHPDFRAGKAVSLDVLGYQVDPHNPALCRTLETLQAYRRTRAQRILENINQELAAAGQPLLTGQDMAAIEETVDGAFGRPHIANYLVQKGLVANRQEAFDRYLIKCNVPKKPLTLEEASKLVRGAGGRLVLAHPNDPNGTSLASLTPGLEQQQRIIVEAMLPYLDGIECWHRRHDASTAAAYLAFTRRHGLLATGGSDCHQQPVVLGTVTVPAWVAEQFGVRLGREAP